jgi:hypothetical protein
MSQDDEPKKTKLIDSILMNVFLQSQTLMKQLNDASKDIRVLKKQTE